MKSFVLFAMICFANPDAPRGITCMEFYEAEKKVYKSPQKCYDAANLVGDTVKQQFIDNDIKILELIIWCVNAKGEIV